MSRLYLVRHGQAAAGWDSDPDPGLSDVGQAQAAEAAERLAAIGPLPVVTSPLRRCRETAAPIERAFGVEAVVDERVGEIPSFGLGVAERGPWLRGLLATEWSSADAEVRAWRDRLVDDIKAIAGEVGDAVIVSHFVAINVVLGAALDDDRVVVSPVDNCSVTEVDVADGRIVVVDAGRTGATQVL